MLRLGGQFYSARDNWGEPMNWEAIGAIGEKGLLQLLVRRHLYPQLGFESLFQNRARGVFSIGSSTRQILAY